MKITISNKVTCVEAEIEDIKEQIKELDFLIDQPAWMWYQEGINEAILKKMSLKNKLKRLEKEYYGE